MWRYLLSLASVLIAACAALPAVLPDFTSVEAVLRRTGAVADQLDDEERDLLVQAGRSPASKLRPSFQQPLRQMKVNSPYGKRGRHRHEGVDLKAADGTPIYAADKGIVVFAGSNIDGYGESVILRHVGGYATLYAHASALRVTEGDRVAKGDCIAYAGDSGNASGPHLHFEVRDGSKPVSPMPAVMPAKRKVASPPPAPASR